MPFRDLSRLAVLLAALAVTGCLQREPALRYLGDNELGYYLDRATRIQYPHVHEPVPEEVRDTEEPRTVRNRRHDRVRDISLAEAIRIALDNSEVIRVAAAFTRPGNTLYANPNFVPSVYDPAIQETGVLFGNRGVEAALADFDPRFSTSINWGRNETLQNNIFAGFGLVPGRTLTIESANFSAQLSKQFRHGGQFSLSHSWLYNGSNIPLQLFPSSYTGTLQAEYRHPLLAGAGAEFTGIAGPTIPGLGAITGVSQGVVIARINNDISLADFEASVRNLLLDVENLYWDLYLAYRVYHSRVVNRNSALQTWRDVRRKKDIGAPGGGPIEEAQARENYHAADAAATAALATLYNTETAFRRLLGLPVNDGEILRPSDEPTTAPFRPDWHMALAESLTRRVELRKQKWIIKSLELQLKAARSLTRPQLDFVSQYRVNAFGDRLFGENDNDGVTAQGLRSAYETLTQGDQTGWGLGLQLQLPLGFRAAHAQVRNLEHRLAKARAVLAAQELEISQELAVAFQQLDEHYRTAEIHFNRRRAAEERLEAFRNQQIVGTSTLDLYLRAQAALAEADIAYYRSLVEYNKAIATLEYRKGTILELDNVILAEGPWDPEADRDAMRRALARGSAKETTALLERPAAFALDEPIDDLAFPVPPGTTATPQNTPPAEPLPESDVPGAPLLWMRAEPAPDPTQTEPATQTESPTPTESPKPTESVVTPSAVEHSSGRVPFSDAKGSKPTEKILRITWRTPEPKRTHKPHRPNEPARPATMGETVEDQSWALPRVVESPRDGADTDR